MALIKPKPKIASYYGSFATQEPKYVWNEPRVYDGKMTIPELINDMYKYQLEILLLCRHHWGIIQVPYIVSFMCPF